METGRPNSPEMLLEWKEISAVAINVVATTTIKTFHMADQLIENEEQLMIMTGIDMTVKIPLSEPSKSRLDSENGQNDTCLLALVNETIPSKSIEWKNGIQDFKIISKQTITKKGFWLVETISQKF